MMELILWSVLYLTGVVVAYIGGRYHHIHIEHRNFTMENRICGIIMSLFSWVFILLLSPGTYINSLADLLKDVEFFKKEAKW